MKLEQPEQRSASWVKVAVEQYREAGPFLALRALLLTFQEILPGTFEDFFLNVRHQSCKLFKR